jgi:hypothetical protein
MYRRTLPKDAVLWWKGSPAESVGILEKGKIGIRHERQLLAVADPVTALGEISVLTLEGQPTTRAADVVSLEDETVVAELPVSDLKKDDADLAVHRLILRTLFGQTCRNALLTMAPHRDNELVMGCLAGLLAALGESERKMAEIEGWKDFLVAFHLLYSLRIGSDTMRVAMGPTGAWDLDEVLETVGAVRSHFKSPATIPYLEQLLRAEKERQTLSEG